MHRLRSYLHLYLLEESNYYKKSINAYYSYPLVTQLYYYKHRCSTTITHGSAYQSLWPPSTFKSTSIVWSSWVQNNTLKKENAPIAKYFWNSAEI
jgi:hypothetical protein